MISRKMRFEVVEVGNGRDGEPQATLVAFIATSTGRREIGRIVLDCTPDEAVLLGGHLYGDPLDVVVSVAVNRFETQARGR